MRAALAAITVSLFAANFCADLAHAQGNDETTASFLDFGVPCTDPHEELQGPPLLNAGKTNPKSNPATPLTQPPYPPLSRRMGEEGSAVLRLLISESGEVSQAHIVQSTGSPRLDSAALEVTRKWQLTPGTVNGKPRCMWGKFAVSFVLSDYTNDELQRITVPPEARALASLLVSIDELRKSIIEAESLSGLEEQILNLTLDEAIRSDQWITAQDKIARILAMEFSQTELVELSQFFGSPVAAKWRKLNFKMTPTMFAQQRKIAESLFCTIQRIDVGLEAVAAEGAQASDQSSEKYAGAISSFVREAIPYCTCLYESVDPRRLAGTGGRPNITRNCGLGPKLQLPP